MKSFKRIISSRITIAIFFFLLGYFTNLYLVKKNNQIFSNADEERIPVTPEDFDHQRLIKPSGRFSDLIEDEANSLNVAELDYSPNRKEDDHFVYYEIPIDKNGKNNKLNVQISDGQIHLKADSSDQGFSSSMEQVFSIEGNLDDKKAEVLNEKDKIIIKIPKKK